MPAHRTRSWAAEMRGEAQPPPPLNRFLLHVNHVPEVTYLLAENFLMQSTQRNHHLLQKTSMRPRGGAQRVRTEKISATGIKDLESRKRARGKAIQFRSDEEEKT